MLTSILFNRDCIAKHMLAEENTSSVVKTVLVLFDIIHQSKEVLEAFWVLQHLLCLFFRQAVKCGRAKQGGASLLLSVALQRKIRAILSKGSNTEGLCNRKFEA